MILLHKIVQLNPIAQQADEQSLQPHWVPILLVTFVLGLPTVSWAKQLDAAVNQPNHFSCLENYSETGEMF